MANLNKENFFNDLQQKFPKAMKHFCDWVDEYKEEVKWLEMFSGNIKFHDIPYDMQVGVLLRYLSEITDYDDMLTIDEVKECFFHGLVYLETTIK